MQRCPDAADLPYSYAQSVVACASYELLIELLFYAVPIQAIVVCDVFPMFR